MAFDKLTRRSTTKKTVADKKGRATVKKQNPLGL